MSSYKWLPDRIIPWPILSTVETCVDWDYFTEWVEERSIPGEDIKTLKGGNLLVHPTLGPLKIEHYQEKDKELNHFEKPPEEQSAP